MTHLHVGVRLCGVWGGVGGVESITTLLRHYCDSSMTFFYFFMTFYDFFMTL